ncbi:MAG: lipid A deacylase LpxR family protein [Gammaproteobacteria bacterium]|nr:lipid A deacylase LpxR family protein [Gammaproteobacteria bacterium]
MQNMSRTMIYPEAIKRILILGLMLSAIASAPPLRAEADWSSLTIDNDIFIGNDSGYSNGIFYSWYDTPVNNKPAPGFLARAMLWSLADHGPAVSEVSTKTIGQFIVTPEDITLEDPPRPPEDLPYGGLLFYTDGWIQSYERHAAKIGVTIGIVGEYSLAEQSQTFVHKITGSDEPEGWDTQLNDEIVFKFSRSQVWRSWASSNGHSDLLLGGDAALGTISSSLGATAMFRYGRQLHRNFATTLLVTDRTANPVATQSGWYLYAATNARYLANNIFLDGNTFDNDGQEPMNYDNEMIGITLGMAYAWESFSLTFAFGDLNVIKDDDEAEEFTEFGTLTLAWKHD